MLHPLLLEKFNRVKKNRPSFYEESGKFTYIQLFDLQKIQNINKEEKNKLKKLVSNECKIFSCFYNNKGYIVSLTLDTFGDSLYDDIKFPYLQHLSLFKMTPSDTKFIQQMTSLKILFLKDQFLSKIPDLSSLVNLEQLFLHSNMIKDINVFGRLPKLKNLQLSKNIISSLEGFKQIKGCKSLRNLNLSYNKISDVIDLKPLSHFPELMQIDLSDNSISELNINFKLPLRSLNLARNKIQHITAIKNLPNLQFLDLSYNRIIHLQNIENLPDLSEVRCKGNPIKNIEVDNLSSKLKISGVYLPHVEICKINNYLALKLIDGITRLFIKDIEFEEFTELSEFIVKHRFNYNPEKTFRRLCLKISQWAYDNYKVRALNAYIAFALLKKLAKAGDPVAKSTIRKEVIKKGYLKNYKDL